MKRYRSRPRGCLSVVLAILCLGLSLAAGAQETGGLNSLQKLVPAVEGWKPAEAPQLFSPANLFEYIDGAAESYLSYDFKDLLAVQFDKEGAEANISLEIYDMGTPLNAFGIFGAERYPENPPVSVGDAGYLEGEALNFAAGRYYVKLLAFGLDDETEAVLTEFARKVAAAIRGKGGVPAALGRFPREDLVPRSEKFIRKNFMGYEFLHDGFTADYRIGGQELEAFLIEGSSPEDAEAGLTRLLDALAKEGSAPESAGGGRHLRNRYGQHLYIGRAGSLLYGVMRVPDDLQKAGEALFRKLADAAGSPPGRAGRGT